MIWVVHKRNGIYHEFKTEEAADAFVEKEGDDRCSFPFPFNDAVNPCKVCGGIAKQYKSLATDRASCLIRCASEGCGNRSGEFSHPLKAIRAWNKNNPARLTRTQAKRRVDLPVL
jgi:hypothetical protein